MTEEELAATPHQDFFDLGYKARLQRDWRTLMRLRRRITWDIAGSMSVYAEFRHGWREANRDLERQRDLFA